MLGAVCISEEYGRKELSFEEILLDETQIRGGNMDIKGSTV